MKRKKVKKKSKIRLKKLSYAITRTSSRVSHGKARLEEKKRKLARL